MYKLAFIILSIIFIAAGCNANNTQNVIEPVQEQTEDQPTFSETDCAFSAYEKVEIKELDKLSCKRISQYLIIDKNNVYKQLTDPGSSVLEKYVIVQEADAETFRPLRFDYYQDKNNLFFDAGSSYRIIKGVDFKTIEVMSTHYLKDKDHVYSIKPENSSSITVIPGLDANSFEVIQNTSNHEQYFKDINGVYFTEDLKVNPQSSVIKQADSNSFQVLDHYLMAKDKNYVYYAGTIVEGADPDTFKILPRDFFKDKSRVYTAIGGFRVLNGIDSSSFVMIGNSDGSWSGYSKDKNKVYYDDAVVEDADVKTFQVRNGKAFDKNYEFQGKFKVQ